MNKQATTLDVVALGELLIDFTESGVSAQGNPLLEANPGGAPCNVLAMLARLGRKTAFIGKVGDDSFGRMLRDAAAAAGVGMDGLLLDGAAHTTLAFVHTAPDGDRDFSFYRDPGADTLLRADEVPEALIARARVFHFGSLSMTHPGVREATRRAVALAEQHGCLRSFDPNLRPPLWDGPEAAHAQIAWGLAHCDLLKIADDELLWFTGAQDLAAGVRALRERYDIPLVLLTKGRDGSSAYTRDLCVDGAPFLLDATIETTGAGDAFCACAIDYVLSHGLERLTEAELTELLRSANAAAALITTRKGALRAMPGPEEIAALCASRAEA